MCRHKKKPFLVAHRHSKIRACLQRGGTKAHVLGIRFVNLWRSSLWSFSRTLGLEKRSWNSSKTALRPKPGLTSRLSWSAKRAVPKVTRSNCKGYLTTKNFSLLRLRNACRLIYLSLKGSRFNWPLRILSKCVTFLGHLQRPLSTSLVRRRMTMRQRVVMSWKGKVWCRELRSNLCWYAA